MKIRKRGIALLLLLAICCASVFGETRWVSAESYHPLVINGNSVFYDTKNTRANINKALDIVVGEASDAAFVSIFTRIYTGAWPVTLGLAGTQWAANVVSGLVQADWERGDDIYYKVYWRYKYLGCTYDSIGTCIPKYKVKQTVAVYADKQYKKCVKLDTGFYTTTDLEAVRHVVKFN